MRIGIDASSVFGWRGPSRNIQNLIRALIKADQKNQYFLFGPQECPQDIILTDNFQWVYLKKRSFLSWINILLPISVIKHKIDIFVFPQDYFWLWKPVKTIIFFRATVIAPFYDGIADKIESSIRNNKVHTVPDHIVFVSNTAATIGKLIYGFNPLKTSVVYNAVDERFAKIAKKVTNTQKEKYLLYVGGTEKNKNLEMLIKACEYLWATEKLIGVQLKIVGNRYGRYGKSQEQMEKQYDMLLKQNKIVFLGEIREIKQLASLYANALLLVFPSLTETFGIVSLEAMACGCPVVASNAPAIPEICGDAAMYFNPYDPKDMAEKIDIVLNNEKARQGLVAKGYEKLKKYSWEESAKKIVTIIEQVAKP